MPVQDNFKTPFMPFGIIPNIIGLDAKVNIFCGKHKYFSRKINNHIVFEELHIFCAFVFFLFREKEYLCRQ